MSERPTIAVINGPNLNLLGTREPETYGAITLPEVIANLVDLGEELGIDVVSFQSNSEGALVDYIHDQQQVGVDGAIINAGAYTHTSVALRDALLGTAIPFVEVHISNVYKREAFRHHSYLSDIALGVMAGFGVRGYELALRWLAEELD